LGDANALIVPTPKLLPLIDVVHQVYDVKRLGGIYAFLDGFSAGKKSPEDYRADLDPLSPREQAAQGEAIERGLKFSDRGIPHISRYDIREFVY